MLKAVPYIRWSKEKQANGSTLRRQTSLVYGFADQMKWPIHREVRDEGTSAWTGENLDTGNLGDFIRQIERDGGEGLVLVVEQIDRISRLNPFDATMNIGRMVETGLTVALADIAMIIDKISIRNQTAQLEAIVSRSAKAHNESEDKSWRIRAAWQDKRDNDEPVHCRSTCPAWLGLTADRKSFLTDTATSMHRIGLINEIFDLYISGMGKRAIARLLNERGEPTWRGGAGWQATAVARIVHNRAVLGEYQHHVCRKPVGDPVPDYFPQVVSNDKWLAANDARHRRIMAAHTTGRKLTNLLSDVARCEECGSRMIFANKARKSNGAPVAYLKCDGNMRGRGCRSKAMVPYYPLETIVLDTLLARAMDDQHFTKDDEVATVRREMADKLRERADINTRLNNLADRLEVIGDDERLVIRYQTLKADEIIVKAALTDLQKRLDAAMGKASRSEHVRRVKEIRADLSGADPARCDEARRLVKLALNDVIERIEINTAQRAAAIHLVNSLGLILISGAGAVMEFDLHKHGSDLGYLTEDRRGVVEAYLRRLAA